MSNSEGRGESTAGTPELAGMVVHVMVMKYPETLAVLREAGVDTLREGADPVASAAADRAGLLDALAAATAWRRAAARP